MELKKERERERKRRGKKKNEGRISAVQHTQNNKRAVSKVELLEGEPRGQERGEN